MNETSAPRKLAPYLEYTLRKADATRVEIERLCAQARERGVFGVCINGSLVAQAAHFLDGTEVKVTCAVAFPLGSSTADVKRYETEAAIDDGAHLIEVVANAGRLKEGDESYVLREFRDVVEAADERPVTVHLDTGLLTVEEIRSGSLLASEAGARGIAFGGPAGLDATLEAIKATRDVVGDTLSIKVDRSDLAAAEIASLLEAGAARFGVTCPAKLLEEQLC
jgi:deoxyribose-phosphate aldolase